MVSKPHSEKFFIFLKNKEKDYEFINAYFTVSSYIKSSQSAF